MKRLFKHIILIIALIATYSCSNELIEIVYQPMVANNGCAIRLSVLPTINNATRAATDAAEWEKKVESLELYYFSQVDKECFYAQRIKVGADGEFGIKEDGSTDTDIPVAEGVFTAAQRNGKYAQFTILAIANYHTEFLTSEPVDKNSYYEAWPSEESSVSKTYQYFKEELVANVMKNENGSYRAGVKGETIAMIAEGNFSIIKGTDVTIGGEAYYQLGSLQLKRVCPKVAIRVRSKSNATFTINQVQFINTINEMGLFEASNNKGNATNNLLNTAWMNVNNDYIQRIDGNDYYIFYINENYQESVAICPQAMRTYIKIKVEKGGVETDYSVLANNSEAADGHYLKRNKVYLTTVVIP